MKYLLILLIFFSYNATSQIPVRAKIGNGSVPSNNQLPQSDAGVDKVITLPTNSVTFFGSGTVYVGTTILYGWTQLSGPNTASLTGVTDATLLAGNLIQGVYEFQLTVTDSIGATATDNVFVTVNAAINIPPVANAGTDSAITLPINIVTLIGSGTDADGTVVSYLWEFQSGPAFGAITTSTDTTTTVTGLTNGTYIFSLTVTDNNGAVGIDYVTVNVLQNPSVIDSTGAFSFVLDTASKVSIGVYRQDSILVKTIVSDTLIQAGTYSALYKWNGTDDYGNPISSPASSYTIKVLTNNVQYTWQGTIGNSSDSMTGDRKHRSYYECMSGLAFGSTYGYFVSGYSEGFPSLAKFAISSPNQKLFIYTARGRGAVSLYVATDDTTVYWGSHEVGGPTASFVHGTKVSDDTEYNFSAGTTYYITNGSINPYRAISLIKNKSTSTNTGLAVQKRGIFLFVARAKMDSLYIHNKTTGALVQQLFYDSCRSLSVDTSGNLWMITGTNTVLKYTVNVDGTLTSTGIGIGGLISPLSTAVSTNNHRVAVTDAGGSQQVKFFSNASGTAIDTMGVLNGYYADALVSNNKFYFSDSSSNKPCFVAYQPNGDFWVNDYGNNRAQHFDSSKNFVNRIMSLGANYAVYVDKNNINKVFSTGLEFEIDYGVQVLTGTTGWTLKRNWNAIVNTARFGAVSNNTTLSNGRVYGFIYRKFSTPRLEVVEYAPNNQLRFTGKLISTSAAATAKLCDDGSYQDYSQSGPTYTFQRYPLTGFDGSNNPIWSSTPEILAIGTKNSTIGSPIIPQANQMFSTTNKILFFYASAEANSSGPIWHTGYHTGLMQKGANNSFLFQTEKSTHRSYYGTYPKAGWFDEGNSVNANAGGMGNIVDRHIVTSYHGEFWKGGQTNYFNHYYDNGLAIGQFGTDRVKIGGSTVICAPGMAGNANTPIVVRDGSGNLYLWHGDEGDHSAIHRWKISGLNTIAEQVINIPFPYNYTQQVYNYTDLMWGLPFNATVPNNTEGWTRFPVKDTIVSPANDTWEIKTSLLKYDKEKPVDVQVRFSHPSVRTYYLNRDLGTNNVTTNWKITGGIAFPGGNVNATGNRNRAYIEILDANDKVLTTFHLVSEIVVYPTVRTRAIGNNAQVYSALNPVGSTTAINITPFEISIIGGSVTFTYAGSSVTTAISDLTGNWRTPKTFRVKADGATTPTNPNYRVDLSDLKLYIDY